MRRNLFGSGGQYGEIYVNIVYVLWGKVGDFWVSRYQMSCVGLVCW